MFVMIDWYGKLYAVVRWNDTELASFHITSGVRQGGVPSPIMFNFYINDLEHDIQGLKILKSEQDH